MSGQEETGAGGLMSAGQELNVTKCASTPALVPMAASRVDALQIWHSGLSRQGTQGGRSLCMPSVAHSPSPSPPPSLPPPRPRYADIIIHYLRGVATGLLARMIALETVQMTLAGGITGAGAETGAGGVPGAGAMARGQAGLDNVSGLHAAEAALKPPLFQDDRQRQKEHESDGESAGDDSGGSGKAATGLCQVVGHRNHSFPVHCAKVRRGGDILHWLRPSPPHTHAAHLSTLFTLHDWDDIENNSQWITHSTLSGPPRYEAPLLPRQ